MLFRRPSSRSNSKLESKNENKTETDIFEPEISICKNGQSLSFIEDTFFFNFVRFFAIDDS